MKKNVMMRIASILLVCVLVTTCGISGTFAKYVTSDNASDVARIAKWGVTATVTGTAFAQKYEIKTATTDKSGANIEYSVESSTAENVIAPGTSGTFTGVNITGTPEVAVNITTNATVTIEGFMLAGNKFYCPVIITINDKDYCGLDYASAAEFQTALVNAIQAANGNYKANTNLADVTGLNGDYEWEWAFVGDDHECTTDRTHVLDQTDGRDTELGNKAANGFLNRITISVETIITQID